MRIRFTIFLLIANVAALLAIFKLEFSQAAPAQSQRALVEITRLQVDGKNVDKPRILVFENNKWRIISPIQWQANYFAVNRILRNLEFIGKAFRRRDTAPCGRSGRRPARSPEGVSAPPQ